MMLALFFMKTVFLNLLSNGNQYSPKEILLLKFIKQTMFLLLVLTLLL